MNQKDFSIHQGIKRWNIIFTLFFITIAAYLCRELFDLGKLPHTIGIFDFIILALSTFRMIRLFVYDNIFLFIREGLMSKKIQMIDGEQTTHFVQSDSSFIQTLYKLAVCPWCMGVWISLCSIFVFYAYPASYVLFLILAIAGVASVVQLTANGLGWSAEYKKGQSERLSSQS